MAQWFQICGDHKVRLILTIECDPSVSLLIGFMNHWITKIRGANYAGFCLGGHTWEFN